MTVLVRTPVEPLDIKAGSYIRVLKPIPSIEAMEYIAQSDADHRGLDLEYQVLADPIHECEPSTYVDPEVGEDSAVTICTICGVQTGRSDLT